MIDGQKEYEYNGDGNLIRAIAGDYAIQYDYTASGMLSKVEYPDGSYVAYEYDAFGRKTTRTESFYKENPDFIPPGQLKDSKSNGNGNGNSIKNSNGHGNGNGNAYGQGNGNAYGQNKGNGNGNSNGQGNGNAYGHVNGNGPLKLEADTTRYLYDGFGVNVLNEYTGNGAPLGEYLCEPYEMRGLKLPPIPTFAGIAHRPSIAPHERFRSQCSQRIHRQRRSTWRVTICCHTYRFQRIHWVPE